MIRPATIADIPAIVECGRLMHAESWYAHVPFDEAKVRDVMARLIEAEGGFLEVFERDGEIAGGLAGMLGEMWFCRSLIASDLALFIRPGRRGSIAAVRLVGRFIDWAKARGAAEVCMAISTGVLVRETGDLYTALGFTHVGGVYKRKVT